MVKPTPEEFLAIVIHRVEHRLCPGCGAPYPASAGLWWTCDHCTDTLGQGLGSLAARLLKGELPAFLCHELPQDRPRRPIPRPRRKPRDDW